MQREVMLEMPGATSQHTLQDTWGLSFLYKSNEQPGLDSEQGRQDMCFGSIPENVMWKKERVRGGRSHCKLEVLVGNGGDPERGIVGLDQRIQEAEWIHNILQLHGCELGKAKGKFFASDLDTSEWSNLCCSVVDYRPMYQEVTDSIPIKAHTQVLGSIPSKGACKRQLMNDIFFIHVLSIPL